jgi:hypothetical protein
LHKFTGRQKTQGGQQREIQFCLTLLRKTGQRKTYRGSANVADDLISFVIGCVVSFYFSSLLIAFTIPIRKDRPFKSPRLANPKEATQDNDEDDRPIAQTLEPTKQSHVHRKDNSEWG